MTSQNNIEKIREKVADIRILNDDDFETIKLLSKNEIIELIQIMNINIENFCEIIMSDK
jgi:hypothetical protein